MISGSSVVVVGTVVVDTVVVTVVTSSVVVSAVVVASVVVAATTGFTTMACFSTDSAVARSSMASSDLDLATLHKKKLQIES